MHDPAQPRAQPAPIATPLFVAQLGAGPPLLLIHGLDEPTECGVAYAASLVCGLANHLRWCDNTVERRPARRRRASCDGLGAGWATRRH